MAGALFEFSIGQERERDRKVYGIALGMVVENVDSTGEARVKVALPWLPGVEPWARIAAPGAGTARGFFSIPQIGDEVLIAFNQGDPTEAFVLGALWSTIARPPALLPTDSVTKRVLRTPAGHVIELDDALQTVTVTTSTQQTVTVGPDAIEMRSGLLPAGQVSTLRMDVAGNVTISAALTLTLDAKAITLKGETITVKGTGTASFLADGVCTVRGSQVFIN